MKKYISILLFILVPIISFAQASGGQIRRPKPRTTANIPRRSNDNVNNSSKERLLSDLQRNMVYVEGGRFFMGATEEQGTESWLDFSRPVHIVSLSSFYISKYEITQDIWIAVMGDNPSEYKGDKLPVTNVSHEDCEVFINKLNQITGKKYRLPTEAEWEFAARGGNKSHNNIYSGGNVLNKVGWYRDNTGKTHNVGLKSPNELGLYDMSGNVNEWCSDLYWKYSKEEQTNPQGGSVCCNYVVRGGSIVSTGEHYCQTAAREFRDKNCTYYATGFRIAM